MSQEAQLGLIPCWDHFVDTPEFKRLVPKVVAKEIEMIDIMAVFSIGMKYGAIKKKDK